MLKKFLVYSLAFVIAGCTKYLDKKPDGSLSVPATLQDLQAMLDFNYLLNQGCPSAGEIASDDFYVTDADWIAADHNVQQNYIWGDDVFNQYDYNDWNEPYQWVLYANTILEYTGKITPAAGEQETWNSIKGSALFLRAHAFFWLAQEFCVPYDAANAATEAGIALRLTPDISAPTSRASVQASYEQVIADLKEAIALLPIAQEYKTRPSKPAAYALLSRTYLAMRNYEQAGNYADSCLRLYDKLINFNTLNTGDYNPVPRFNDEVIYQCVLFGYGITYPPVAKIDSSLYALYADNDMRKVIFYKTNDDGTHSFYGSYDGTDNKFGGIATDEMYFVKAECAARQNNKNEALDVLNSLLVQRYATGTFTPATAANAATALQIILTERRKELVWRGLRWMDLRRLNTEPQFATTINRHISGSTYTLPPGDKRYVFMIPEKVIQLSGIEQNTR